MIAHPVVSIIIPVYNSERYLEECLESIFHQDFKDYEVIIIDDGSCDGSKKIYEKAIEKNPKITAYYQNNRGVSAARNAGLSRAKGEFVVFVDSDDVLSYRFLQNIIQVLRVTDSDVLFWKKVRFTNNIVFKEGKRVKWNTYTIFGLWMSLLYCKIRITSTNLAYRRNKFCNCLFSEDIFVGEDVLMMANVLSNMPQDTQIPYIKSDIYGYRIHRDSLSHCGGWKRKLTAYDSMKKIENMLQFDTQDVKRAMINRKMNTVRMIYRSIPWKENTERKRAWTYIKQYRKIVLFDADSRKRERLAALVSFGGEPVYRMFLMLVM